MESVHQIQQTYFAVVISLARCSFVFIIISTWQCYCLENISMYGEDIYEQVTFFFDNCMSQIMSFFNAILLHNNLKSLYKQMLFQRPEIEMHLVVLTVLGKNKHKMNHYIYIYNFFMLYMYGHWLFVQFSKHNNDSLKY